MRAPVELHFSLDEFAARLVALRRRMVAAGIDVLLLTTPENSCARPHGARPSANDVQSTGYLHCSAGPREWVTIESASPARIAR